VALSVSTAEVDDRSRYDYWRDAICATFVPLELDVPRRIPKRFHGSLTMESLDVVEVATVDADPHSVYRSPRAIRRSSADDLFVMMPRSGTVHIAQDGRRTWLRTGDFATYDSSRPCRIWSEECIFLLVMKIPRAAFATRCLPPPSAETTAVAIRRDDGAGAVVSPFLRALPDKLPTVPRKVLRQLGGTALDLVSAALSGLDADDEVPVPHSAQRLRAQRYILDHLGDPQLGPADVAGALGISVRYLYLLFQEEATSPGRWLTGQRLAMAAHLLRDEASAGSTVTEIAFRVGFKDASVFSRAFKARYGLSPRGFRARLG
jgi:AraC-like DNA-binding protein